MVDVVELIGSFPFTARSDLLSLLSIKNRERFEAYELEASDRRS
jgi:hypothetical protein